MLICRKKRKKSYLQLKKMKKLALSPTPTTNQVVFKFSRTVTRVAMATDDLPPWCLISNFGVSQANLRGVVRIEGRGDCL